jgi:hypothetical protein
VTLVSERRRYNITGSSRVFAFMSAAGGISGTETTTSTEAPSRPDEFVYNGAAARSVQLGYRSR